MTEVAEQAISTEQMMDDAAAMVGDVGTPLEPVDLGQFGVRYSPVGVTFARDTPIQVVAIVIRQALGQENHSRWVIGDALAYAYSTYGEMASQLEGDGNSEAYQTLRNKKSVSERVPQERRRPELSWSHHEAVARLDPEMQEELLAKAADEHLSRDELREEVKNVDALPGDHQRIHSSDSVEHGTPAEMIESVKEVLGDIDLDPASSEFFNETVGAKRFFSEEDDGLSCQWHGKVYVNPPYGKEGSESRAGIWVAKLLEEYQEGRVSEAILEVNANTGQGWFLRLWEHTLCFVARRLAHYNASGPEKSPTNASVYVYLGDQPERFAQVFRRHGTVVRVPEGWEYLGPDSPF